MPLRVVPQVEPFTEASKDKPPVLAKSAEYRRLYRDLERYTTGQISGRSYLIAGHRGSGKTMLVHKAIEDVLRDSQGRDHRPVFVRLHGPDLLPREREKADSTENGGKKSPTAASPHNQIAIAFSGDSPASINTSLSSPDAQKADEDLINVLTQMVKCLFRDVTNEFRKRIRDKIAALPPGYRRQELFEVAAQFELEMADCPTAARLRSFWYQLGALEWGVLFDRHITPIKFGPFFSGPAQYEQYLAERNAPATDEGMQEILVLSFLSQAFQVIAGKIEEKQRQTEAGKSAESSSLSTAYALKNLLAPVAGLLTGGAVGAEVARRDGPAVAVLLGLLTGAVVSFSFSYSSSRSRSKEISQESIFIRDRSVPSLSSVLPMLISRLREIGLAPIFVIDELDKVQDLQTKMQKLVQHLKFLVTENSFSCFLTDRRYLSRLNQQENEVAYAPEYTYFSDRLLILYEPRELRQFVMDSFETLQPPQSQKPEQAKPQQDKDREDSEKIAYVILHRAQLHPVDIRRQIDRLTAKESFSIADFPSPSYRFEILTQVAIEWLLNGEDVQTQIAGSPDSRQIVYDALYYVSRLWEDASSAEIRRVPGFHDFAENPNEKKPGLVLEEAVFSKYIQSRVAAEEEESGNLQGPAALPLSPPPTLQPRVAAGKEGFGKIHESPASPPPNPSPPLKTLSGTDFDLLFLKVRELLSLLCNPSDFYKTINESKRTDKPPIYILNEIPKDSLLERLGGTSNYVWLYDVSGRYLQTREVNTVIADVKAAISRIKDLASQVDQLLQDFGGLQRIADHKIIPRTPEWVVVKPAIERLNSLISNPDPQPYGKMVTDRDCVVEFASTLPKFEANVKAALICAGIFAPEIGPAGDSEAAQVTRFCEALTRISELLQLSTSREDDLRKLNSVISSRHINCPVKSGSDWSSIVSFVRDSMKKTERIDPDPIVQSAWNICKSRFTQRFHEGAAQFDPQFEDIFTSIRAVGPGRALPFDLSTVAAKNWTTLLLRSFLPDALINVPEWLRVAAALELEFIDLAEKLAHTLPNDGQLQQWVNDSRLRVPAQLAARRNILILAAEKTSMAENWLPSTRCGALVSTVADFGRLLDCLKKHDILKATDFPIGAVRIELTGDRGSLGMLATMKPAAALAAMSAGRTATKAAQTITKDVEAFLNLEDIGYFSGETPLITSPTPPSTLVATVVAPKGVDDLADRSPSPRTPPQ
ncbi:MAG: hypothetical protein ABR874_22690 [Candidatus Sulfotelmatobacter sp.]|jgi:hypothetical protein